MAAGALALAQINAPAPESATAIASTAAIIRLPELTPLRLRVVGEVSSKLGKVGDKVTIVLAEALQVSDSLAIPAGTSGTAEVIHVARPGMGGKAGELLVAARTLDLPGGVTIPLRSFRLDAARGKNNEGIAAGLAIAGGGVGSVAAMFITGGTARIASGSEAFAKTAAAVDIPASSLVTARSSAGPLVHATQEPAVAGAAANIQQED